MDANEAWGLLFLSIPVLLVVGVVITAAICAVCALVEWVVKLRIGAKEYERRMGR